METADVRRRVQRAIAAAKAGAAARRERVAAAEEEGRDVLRRVASPLFKTVAAALVAEGYRFSVSTPAEAVRLSSGTSGEDFIELVLDTARDPPALLGRTAHGRGRRVVSEERVVAEHPAIGELTAGAALDFVLETLAPFVER